LTCKLYIEINNSTTYNILEVTDGSGMREKLDSLATFITVKSILKAWHFTSIVLTYSRKQHFLPMQCEDDLLSYSNAIQQLTFGLLPSSGQKSSSKKSRFLQFYDSPLLAIFSSEQCSGSTFPSGPGLDEKCEIYSGYPANLESTSSRSMVPLFCA
jgi:hypothetical protein